MHNALYRAYLTKIFPAVEELAEEIIRGGKDDWLPDIFAISSEVLIKIFREHELEVPPELKIFRWADYLGEGIKSRQAVGTIENLFEFFPKIFSWNERKDRLIIDLSTLDQKTQQKVSEVLEAELPPSTEKKSCRKYRDDAPLRNKKIRPPLSDGRQKFFAKDFLAVQPKLTLSPLGKSGRAESFVVRIYFLFAAPKEKVAKRKGGPPLIVRTLRQPVRRVRREAPSGGLRRRGRHPWRPQLPLPVH